MKRREIFIDESTVILYIVYDAINVSKIVSELISMGCSPEEAQLAYRILSSDDADYSYTKGDKVLLVFDCHHDDCCCEEAAQGKWMLGIKAFQRGDI